MTGQTNPAGSSRKYATDGRYGGEPYQPHPGTQCHRCGCSLPGLTGFTADRCEGTGRAHHNETRLAASGAIVPAYQQLTTTGCRRRARLADRPLPTSKLPPVSNTQNRRIVCRIASKPSSQRLTSVRGWQGSSAVSNACHETMLHSDSPCS